VSRTTTRSTSQAKLSQTSSAVLKPLTDPDLAPPASRLDGRPLRPIPFRAERGSAVQSDGSGLTKVGARFRDVFADVHGIDPDQVDIGLIRLVEALNADTDHNHASLSAVQTKRTEFGVLYQVRFLVNTSLLLPWLINGRALRRLGSALGGTTKLLTTAVDHDRYELPVMEVEGAEAVLEIVNAQRKLVKLDSYTSADKKRDRIDSIVQFGVLEPPDVVLTSLVSPSGTSWVAEAAEGAQRLFSSLVGLDALALRSVHTLATAHWFGAEGAEIRDFTAEDVRGLEEALRFKSTAAAGYFPGTDEASWLKTTAVTTPAAVAFQLMRTMTVNLTLRVQPDTVTTADERNPVAATIQELIRSYHVPGKMKDAWEEADVNGLVAIGVIDELRAQGRVSERERSSWLGERPLPWAGPSIGKDGEAGNRLVSTTRLMAAMTAEDAVAVTDAGGEASLAVVNRLLRQNSTRRHPDTRAKVAAAQAVAALELHSTGDAWPDLLGMPLRDLSDQARRENDKAAGDPTVAAGPGQRALAALGAVALIANPGLITEGKALTQTGRGAGGQVTKVKASDPSVLLQRMVTSDRGINQLEDAIAALVANAEPTLPTDRETREVLGDLELRAMWLGTDRDPSQTPNTEFARRLKELADRVNACLTESEDLRLETPTASWGPRRTTTSKRTPSTRSSGSTSSWPTTRSRRWCGSTTSSAPARRTRVPRPGSGDDGPVLACPWGDRPCRGAAPHRAAPRHGGLHLGSHRPGAPPLLPRAGAGGRVGRGPGGRGGPSAPDPDPALARRSVALDLDSGRHARRRPVRVAAQLGRCVALARGGGACPR